MHRRSSNDTFRTPCTPSRSRPEGVPFPSTPASAAASPSPSSAPGSIPRPPNAWILYRSHKLDQLKRDRAFSSESGTCTRGALTAGALALLGASEDTASPGVAANRPRSSSPTPSLSSEMTSAMSPSTMAYTPSAAAPSPCPDSAVTRGADVSSLLAQLWRSEPEAVRQSFHEMAKQKQQEHKRLWPEYKYQPRETLKSKLAREKRRMNSGETESIPNSPAAAPPPSTCHAASQQPRPQPPTPPKPPKPRNSSLKRARKQSDGAMSSPAPTGSPSPSSATVNFSRKRRTPDRPRVPTYTSSGSLVQRGNDANRQIATYLDGTANPADLTLAPQASPFADLEPPSWTADDMYAFTSYVGSQRWSPIDTSCSPSTMPALPPSERHFATAVSNSPVAQKPSSDHIDIDAFFDNDPYVRMAKNPEPFELDPELASIVNRDELFQDSLFKEPADVAQWPATSFAQVHSPRKVTPPLMPDADWLKSINWDLVTASQPPATPALQISNPSPPPNEPFTKLESDDWAASVHDLAEFIVSHGGDAGAGSGSVKGSLTEQGAASSSPRRCPRGHDVPQADLAGGGGFQSNSDTRASNTRKVRRWRMSLPRTRTRPFSLSPPPVPSVTAHFEKTDEGVTSDGDEIASDGALVDGRDQQSAGQVTHPLLMASTPTRSSATPVLRSSRSRPRIERHRQSPINEAECDVISPEGTRSEAAKNKQASAATHAAAAKVDKPNARSSPSTHPAPCAIELHGSYTEEELMDILAQRRLARRGGAWS